jgi:hypothetical protein
VDRQLLDSARCPPWAAPRTPPGRRWGSRRRPSCPALSKTTSSSGASTAMSWPVKVLVPRPSPLGIFRPIGPQRLAPLERGGHAGAIAGPAAAPRASRGCRRRRSDRGAARRLELFLEPPPRAASREVDHHIDPVAVHELDDPRHRLGPKWVCTSTLRSLPRRPAGAAASETTSAARRNLDTRTMVVAIQRSRRAMSPVDSTAGAPGRTPAARPLASRGQRARAPRHMSCTSRRHAPPRPGARLLWLRLGRRSPRRRRRRSGRPVPRRAHGVITTSHPTRPRPRASTPGLPTPRRARAGRRPSSDPVTGNCYMLFTVR